MGITFWEACKADFAQLVSNSAIAQLFKIFLNATRIGSPANVDKNHKILAFYRLVS